MMDQPNLALKKSESIADFNSRSPVKIDHSLLPETLRKIYN